MRYAETKSLLQWEKVPRNEADEVFLGKTTIFDTSSLAPWCDDFFPLEKAWCTPLINTTKCNDQKAVVNALSVMPRHDTSPIGRDFGNSNVTAVCKRTLRRNR